MLKFDRPTLVTITAPTCAGKNYLRDRIETELHWNRIVSTTTRAKRAGEIEGEDYYFISDALSKLMEDRGEFAELIEFLGVRYGVTKNEMNRKMSDVVPPMVILEPQGLKAYKSLCLDAGYSMFRIFVSTQESIRLERARERARLDLEAGLDVTKVRETLQKRLSSIQGDERRWQSFSEWEAIVPGDDVQKALRLIRDGVEWQNKKNREPAQYDHVL
jgi:guanylate kinase